MCNLFQSEMLHFVYVHGDLFAFAFAIAIASAVQLSFCHVNSVAQYLILFLFIAVSPTSLMNANCDSFRFVYFG